MGYYQQDGGTPNRYRHVIVMQYFGWTQVYIDVTISDGF